VITRGVDADYPSLNYAGIARRLPLACGDWIRAPTGVAGRSQMPGAVARGHADGHTERTQETTF